MDDLSEEDLCLLVILKAVEIFQKDFDEFMPRWMEVQGLCVSFNDIKEPKNDYFQIIYN